jgi:uncharacterized membrane protein YfcA
MVAVTLLTIVLPLELAAAIVTVPIVVSNLWLSIQGGRFLIMIRRFWLVMLALGAGVFTGAMILVGVDPGILFSVLGVMVFVFSAMELANYRFPPPEKVGIGWGIGAGFFGGITGGISTIWGPIMLIYLSMQRMAKDEFVSAVAVTWFIGSLFLVAAFSSYDVLTIETSTLSAIATLPVIAGTSLGRIIRKRISQERFRKIVSVCLMLVALNLLRRGFFG